jgi:DNA-binding MurR/RpiR family transcriptional regulator
MNANDSFIDRIGKYAPKLSRSLAKLADYLLNNYKEAAFLSAVQLGKRAGVSEAAAVRLAHSLGYGGYTEMLRDIRNHIKNEMTTLEKLESYSGSSEKSTLDENVFNNLQIVKSVRKYIDNKSIGAVVDLMGDRKFIAAGFESEASVAGYMSYYLSRIGRDVVLINGINDDLLNILKNSGENSVAFIFAYPRYTNKIINICSRLKENGVKIVTITDSPLSPVSRFSDQAFVIPLHDSTKTNMDAMVGIITLCQAIIMEYGKKHFEAAQSNLEKLERFNKEFNIFLDVPKHNINQP